ncbi:HupE/UreJ family protein [Roseitranquillus sediminis]|uniref:HupE/UreJ family protein n=1 Tax=Roseitranquillus sediminis TaxID=2809051 RepID=UPI001D0BFEE2|nr:HupE/UreJ family protein [Roseitranquillus sediminis]MBM9596028.1 HupE/UreJ family protein [Roseitranquillus sediminis]
MLLLHLTLALAAVGGAGTATAHEVPNEVTVLTYVKPEGDTLTLLLRLPMDSLRDVDIATDSEGYLDLPNIRTSLEGAAQIWVRDVIEVYENGEPLPQPEVLDARVSLPSDDTFTEGYDAALAHTTQADLPADTKILWEQGLLQIAYGYPISSENSSFSIEPALARLGLQVNVVMRYLGADGTDRVYDVHADVGQVHLDPSWWQTVWLYSERGFREISARSEYLLLLLAMAMPLIGSRQLLITGGAFLLGQTAGLMASGWGLTPNTLWFPYLVSFLIAASIIYLSVENIVGATYRRRWRVSPFLGLPIGFALSAPFAENVQFAGAHLLTAIIAFDAGAGLAALAALALAIAALQVAFRFVVPARVGTIVLSAFVAHSAWHMAVERAALLGQFPWPPLEALVASGAMSWLIAIIASAMLLWIFSGLSADPEDGADRNSLAQRF